MSADTTTAPATLAEFAAYARSRISENFPPGTEHHRNAVKLCGEAGEAAEAIMRLLGESRRPGTLEEAGGELADVVITAYVAAAGLGIDLDAAWKAKAAKIMGRPWKENGDG